MKDPTGGWWKQPVVVLVALLVAAVACTPAAQPSPAPPPAQPKAPAEKAAPAPEAPAAKPAQPAPAAKPAEPEPDPWEQIVEAAKQEGRIVIYGPQGAGNREALVDAFQNVYPEIEVEMSQMAGADVSAKVIPEQDAGLFIPDLLIAGTTTLIGTDLKPNYFSPMQEYLVGPNSGDPTVWIGGDYTFADDEGMYNLMMSVYAKEAFVYNPDQFDPTGFTSMWELLEPQWRGEIVTQDPRRGGPTQAQMLWAYISPELGQEWIRRFWQEQDVTIMANAQQAVDGVIRGSWTIGYGLSNSLINESIDKGLPLGIMDGHGVEGGNYLTAGSGSVAIPKNPPNPNALKVYLDWLSSVEGQYAWSRGHGFATLRRGVELDHVDPAFVVREDVEYTNTALEHYVNMRPEVVEFVNSVTEGYY